ncbi:hypothetical protein BFP76_07705 [Amylibacter kogurei]|uniref:Uncharacterized protein n=1 Tax=Paramylibacter kogurei TaxID=1889778 RepID=A0A2G5K1M6_9RHOB|nr:hypothetical protein BFP76_07705 [Amylibacter kogurei]
MGFDTRFSATNTIAMAKVCWFLDCYSKKFSRVVFNCDNKKNSIILFLNVYFKISRFGHVVAMFGIATSKLFPKKM